MTENIPYTTHLMGLTSCGGLPLFTRRKGDGDALPFSVVASLNGVYMFGKSLSAIMKSTTNEDCTIVWREFEDSITLIVSAYGVSEIELEKFLQVIFDVLVLHVGIQELKEPKNIERLKRDLRACYPLIDRLLNYIHPTVLNDKSVCKGSFQIINMIECTLCQENSVLQTYLESHVENLSSLYGCILLHGRLAVATPDWWTLSFNERILLTLLIQTDTLTCLRDYPVFLPNKSPEVPFRLVSVQLTSSIEVITLCGPTPLLAEVEILTPMIWRHAGDILKSLAVPRTLPSSLILDRNILAILLVRPELDKYVMCTDPHGEKDGFSSHRASVLHSFYRKIITNFGPDSGDEQKPLESYWCSEFHKCHALLSSPNQLFVLFAANLPIPTIRVLSKHTLKLITSDKMYCW